MKLLLDENLSPLHARTLRELGHDAVSVTECGRSGADDSAVRAFAIEDDRTIDALLRLTISKLAGVNLKGKLVVADTSRIRIRG